MMPFPDWTGLSGLALVWMLLALRLPFARRFSSRQLVLLITAVYCVVMLPVAGLSLAGWLRGMVGDLSITSVLLLAVAIITRMHRLAGGAADDAWFVRQRLALLSFISVLAFLLYPFALGISMVDPYRFGFGSAVFIVSLGVLSLWALKRNLVLLALTIALAVLAWRLAWYESTNLWDYLIDVPLAIYAVGALPKLLLNIVRGKRAKTES